MKSFLKTKRPVAAVDAIILYYEKGKFQGIVLVERKFEPKGWALPGGLVEWGESVERCVVREAKEETGLKVKVLKQLHTYSEPSRDKRFHSISTVFLCKGSGKLEAQDDAKNAKVFPLNMLPKLCFDHNIILEKEMEEIGKVL